MSNLQTRFSFLFLVNISLFQLNCSIDSNAVLLSISDIETLKNINIIRLLIADSDVDPSILTYKTKQITGRFKYIPKICQNNSFALSMTSLIFSDLPGHSLLNIDQNLISTGRALAKFLISVMV